MTSDFLPIFYNALSIAERQVEWIGIWEARVINRRIAFLPLFLLFGISVCWGAPPPASPLTSQGARSMTCLTADQFGCSTLIRTGINEEGYFLVIETGERGADSVQVKLRGRSILISRSEFRRTERSSDAGRFAVVSRSNRFARRLMLPPDADMRRVSRSERDGVITIIVPRLHPTRSGPGSFYHPYR